MSDETLALPGEHELTDPTDFQLFVVGDVSWKKAKPPARPARGTASSYGPSGPIGFVRVP